MKWTRWAATILVAASVSAAGSPGVAVAQVNQACKKQCDNQALACSRAKTDPVACDRAWRQCMKPCRPAPKASTAPAPAPKKQ